MKTAWTAALLSLGLLAVAVQVPLLAHDGDHRRHHAWILHEESLPAEPGGRLEVRMGDSDVRLIAHDGDGVEIRVHARSGSDDEAWVRTVFERMRYRAVRRGNTISVEASEPRISGREWDRHRWVSVDFEIRHPVRTDLEIVTVDGDVVADRIEGTVRIASTDGDVVIESCSGPSALLRTDDGDVIVRSLDVEHAEIQSVDGDLIVRRLATALEARTQDGDVKLHVERPVRLRLTTDDGDVAVTGLGRNGLNVDLVGEHISLPPQSDFLGTLTSRRAQGELNGGGPLVYARTGDGDVSLRE